MANNRRMVSKRITKSSRFLTMPNDVQLLYFHILTEADDDGVVEVYPLIRLLGVPSDNLKVLIAKDFVREINEYQVMIITHWLEHNTIRADRKTDSIYLEQVKEMYPDMEFVEAKQRSDTKKYLDSPRTDNGQRKLSKVKLSKDNINNTPFDLFWKEYPNKENKKKAKEIWKRKNLDTSLQEIIDFIKKARETDRWKKGIIPHPTTFLNQERWEDDLTLYENKNKKTYYRGDPVVESRGKKYVISDGQWLEFAGKDEDLEHK